MDLITLLGDIDENFYQLGLKDKNSGKLVHQDVKNMLRTPWESVNRVLEEVAKVAIKNTLLKKTEHYRHLQSYSEGMGIKIEEAAYTMLVPEIVSALSKWAPGFIKGNLGCSSFMGRNLSGEVIHGRILDFPLMGSYDLYERAILYDLKDLPKMVGFNSAGIPYPSITLMTESGMTLALHQKFTNIFNPKGQSIFEYIFDLTKNCNDKKSVIEFIENHPSLTTWCLYITFKNGDVIAADIMGEKSYINQLQIPDKGLLYFCNHLEDKSINQRELLPLGFDQYNHMRAEIAALKINQFHKKKKGENPTDLELLELMTRPFDQKIKDFKDYRLDNLTPSSLTVLTMNPTAGVAHYLAGEAPKVYKDQIVVLENSWRRPEIKALKIKKITPELDHYNQGLKFIMLAQKGFDLHDPVMTYHHLQMAQELLEGHPEKNLAHFYFLVAQYIHETHPKILTNVLGELKKIEGHLPDYLNDHCLLFIGRLERILQIHPSLEEDKIQNKKLRDIYDLEYKIPRAIFHLTTKKTMFPRIDILDILYIYTNY